MTTNKPDRWSEVKRIVREALTRSRDDREAFVRQACGHDEALESEVQSLLLNSDQASDAGFMSHEASVELWEGSPTTPPDVQESKPRPSSTSESRESKSRSSSEDVELSWTAWKEIEQICDRFEAACKRDERPKAEDFLVTEWPEAQRSALLRGLLVVELDYQSRTGRPLVIDDYAHRFPGYEPAIEAAFSIFKERNTHGTEPVGAEDSTSRMIGPYKLLQQIGEGGMGAVWMAEQEQPVRRRVALKLIRAGSENREVIARFEAERQALAMMDHPNIAKVLDAGTAEDGTPYFVMELVQGDPITKYCDIHRLTPDERLQLFAQACDAVQHAHHKGVIHRDLKPSNILVHIHNGKAEVKVIDFGLAKALEHQSRLTDKTLFTEFGKILGTVQYMSPEQARLDAIDIDTRTDVYSLGVILYELLAGSTPIEKKTLQKNAVIEVLELIREREPPRPSNRLSSSIETLESLSAQRQIQPSKLQQILRGELDWIVMRALEKDRTRRYPTPNDFAEDVRRYLEGDPVVARPPSTAYRLRKFVRKNRVTVGVIAGLFVLITVAAFAVNQARVEAVRAMTRAEEANQATARVNAILSNMLSSADPANALGEELTVRQVLDVAIDEMDDADELPKSVESQVRTTIGNTYQSLGVLANATEQLAEAVELERARSPINSVSLAYTLTQYGGCLFALAEYESAVEVMDEAAQLLEGQSSIDMMLALRTTGDVHVIWEEFDEARDYLNRAVAMGRELEGQEATRALAESLNSLGVLMVHSTAASEAIPYLQECLELRRSVLSEIHPSVAATLTNLGSAHAACGQLDKATHFLGQGLEIREQVLPEDHLDIAYSQHNLGWIELNQDRRQRGFELLSNALRIRREQLPDTHPDVLASLENTAIAACYIDDHVEAARLFEQCIEATKRSSQSPRAIAVRLSTCAPYLQHIGQTEAAIRCWREAVSLYKTHGMDADSARSQIGLVTALLADQQINEAAEVLLEFLESLQPDATPELRASVAPVAREIHRRLDGVDTKEAGVLRARVEARLGESILLEPEKSEEVPSE